MNIEVTNLNLSLIDVDLRRLFAPYGEVSSVNIVRDRFNNRSRGKAIIKMPVEREAQKAISSLHGYTLLGKVIYVAAMSSINEERSSDSLFLK